MASFFVAVTRQGSGRRQLAQASSRAVSRLHVSTARALQEVSSTIPEENQLFRTTGPCPNPGVFEHDTDRR